MSDSVPSIPPGFDEMEIDAQLEIVHALWDRIAARPEAVPVPEWHLRLLGERLERGKGRPETAMDWDEFEEKLMRRFSGPGA